jgi:hypothetical protein
VAEGIKRTRHQQEQVLLAADVNPTRLRLAQLKHWSVDMDVVKAVETYIAKMVAVPSAMKVLLLDSHTVRHNALSPS